MTTSYNEQLNKNQIGQKFLKDCNYIFNNIPDKIHDKIHDYTVDYKSKNLSTNLQELSQNEIVLFLLYEIPLIFKIKYSANSCILTKDNTFIFNIKQICKLASNISNKNYSLYNKSLNYILQHINNDTCTDENINMKRSIIRNMCLYKNEKSFHVNIFDKVNNENISTNNENIPTPTSNENICTRIKNYDGNNILKNQFSIRINTSTQISDPSKESGGIAFGFDSEDVFFSMLICAIENTNINSLKYHNKNWNSIYGGNLLSDGISFYLELRLRHNNVETIILSSSIKIIHHLCNQPLNHGNIKKILNCYSISGMSVLGNYYKYHKLVQKRIFELINHSFSLPEFRFVYIECYRNNCNHKNIFDKTYNSVSTCKSCNIAEFCLKCGKESHGGTCDNKEDASNEWEKLNTKKCPKCITSIEKNEGCNHMKCSICHTHFCWICEKEYTINEINDHYEGSSVYNRCRNNEW